MLLSEIKDVTTYEDIKNIDKSRLEGYVDQFLDWLVDKCFDLFIAFIFLFVGIKISKFIIKIIKKSFTRSGLEPSVAGFLISLIKGILYSIVFIMAISILGFQATSLITILGTASLAIGLALQGSLSNFAGGVLILLMKPFKVGDYIVENSGKCEGTVVSIDIFYTKLRTYDNKIVVIPNGSITANSVVNITMEGTRKLDITVGVAYGSDIEKVKSVLKQIIDNTPECDTTQGIDVFVDSFSDSCIKMGIRCMVSADKYWTTKWEINEKILASFSKNNIVIPFNQLEVKVTGQGEVQ